MSMTTTLGHQFGGSHSMGAAVLMRDMNIALTAPFGAMTEMIS